MKKRKSLLLATVFSFALTPLAMAESKCKMDIKSPAF